MVELTGMWASRHVDRRSDQIDTAADWMWRGPYHVQVLRLRVIESLADTVYRPAGHTYWVQFLDQLGHCESGCDCIDLGVDLGFALDERLGDVCMLK